MILACWLFLSEIEIGRNGPSQPPDHATLDTSNQPVAGFLVSSQQGEGGAIALLNTQDQQELWLLLLLLLVCFSFPFVLRVSSLELTRQVKVLLMLLHLLLKHCSHLLLHLLSNLLLHSRLHLLQRRG